MVYDDAKNLVGSLHYRSQDDFVEGLELSLDSHVLVQVEEKLSESTTDLTPLLSRQKQDGADNFVKPVPPTRATLSRINAANSQIKPKSIKELLAGSQGSIGRARLPNKSPYEERHPPTETQPPEPEPELKRRKIIPDKENRVEVPQSIRPSTRRKIPVVHNQPSPPSAIVDIPSDDEVIPLPRKGGNITRTQAILPGSSEATLLPPNLTGIAKRSLAVPATAEPKRHKKNQRIQSEVAPQPKEQAAKKPKKSGEEPAGNPSKPSSAPPARLKTSTAKSSISQIRHPAGPRSSLKFAAEKSRPKLMYRALLIDSSKPAGGSNSTAATIDSAMDTSSGRSDDNGRRIRRPRPTNVIDTDRFFAPSQLARDAAVAAVTAATAEPFRDTPLSDGPPSLDRLEDEDVPVTPRSDSSNTDTPMLDQDVTATVPDSPLFLPRTASQISPLPSRTMAIDDSHVSFLSQALNVARSRKSISPVHEAIASSQSSIGNDSPRLSPEPPSSPVFHKLLSTVSPDKVRPDQVFPDTINIPKNSSAPAPVTSKTLTSIPSALPAQVRLFRRIQSENIERAGSSSESLPDDIDDDDKDSLSGLPENVVLEKSPKRLEKPQVQPHSFSDPVEIRPPSPTLRSAPSSPDIGDDEEQLDGDYATTATPAIPETTTEYIPVEESGPWTSTEAFLLFDWWPPGRQKPPYAVNTTSGTNDLEREGSNEVSRTNVNLMSKKKYGTFGSAKFVSQR